MNTSNISLGTATIRNISPVTMDGAVLYYEAQWDTSTSEGAMEAVEEALASTGWKLHNVNGISGFFDASGHDASHLNVTDGTVHIIPSRATTNPSSTIMSPAAARSILSTLRLNSNESIAIDSLESGKTYLTYASTSSTELTHKIGWALTHTGPRIAWELKPHGYQLSLPTILRDGSVSWQIDEAPIHGNLEHYLAGNITAEQQISTLTELAASLLASLKNDHPIDLGFPPQEDEEDEAIESALYQARKIAASAEAYLMAKALKK